MAPIHSKESFVQAFIPNMVHKASRKIINRKFDSSSK